MNEAEMNSGLAKTPGYRYADRVGNQLFISGQMPWNEEGEIVGRNNPEIQAETCLNNLNKLLRLYGFEITDLRRITVYVVGNRDDLTVAWNAVRSWFNDAVPPATLLGVALLGYPDQMVEIDATIVKE